MLMDVYFNDLQKDLVEIRLVRYIYNFWEDFSSQKTFSTDFNNSLLLTENFQLLFSFLFFGK